MTTLLSSVAAALATLFAVFLALWVRTLRSRRRERRFSVAFEEAAARLDGAAAELRGLLAEIQREHHVNRALMRQELAFLDHLVRTFAADEQPAYRPPAQAGAPQVSMQRHHALDLRA